MVETIVLQTRSGKQALASVKLMRGEFAIHRDVLADWSCHRNLWKVSHFPSGTGMAQCEDLAVAIVVATVLASLPVGWPQKPPSDKKEWKLASVRILNQLPIEVEKWLKWISNNILHGKLTEAA